MRSKWLTRRAVLATTALVIWVPGCLVAGWWQATVALAGNTLSYLYTVEWPAFAVLGVYVWWHLVHLDPETVGARGLARLRAVAGPAAGSVPGPGPGPDAHSEVTGGEAGARGGANAGGEAGARGDRPATAAGERGATLAVAAAIDDPGAGTTAEDEELRAYNEYLASLRERPKTWLRR